MYEFVVIVVIINIKSLIKLHSRFLTYKMQKIPNVATIVQILYLIKAFRKVQ